MSDFAYPLHEECGVFGIYDRAGTEDVAAAAYSALYALQHRGQESCGIAVNDDGVIQGHRDLGLVNEVFTPAVLGSLSTPTAHMATGHVRYATAGSRVRANAQPMIVRHGRGTMALCHNGNLTNALELRRQLENEGAIFHGSSDTEVICYLITRNRLRMGSIETAISKTMDVLEGAYSLVIMSATKLIAVRDPRGYRPLCIGTLPKDMDNIENLNVDINLPKADRMLVFLQNVKNPYAFIVNGLKVKFEYSDKGLNINQCIENLIMNRIKT